MSGRSWTSKASSSGSLVASIATRRWNGPWMRWASTTAKAMSEIPTIDLEDLGLAGGAHLLIERALAGLAPGDRLRVYGRDPQLGVHLRAWGRARGNHTAPDL